MRRRWWRARLPGLLLLWLGLCLWPAVGLGQAWGGGTESRPAAGLEILSDPGRSLTLAEILAQGEAAAFEPVRGTAVNLGFTRTAAWLRLSIESPRDQDAFVSMSPNFVDLVDVYLPRSDGSGLYDHLALGDNRPVREDGVSGLANVVPVSLRAHEEVVLFIRIAAVNSALGLSIDVYPAIDHTRRTTVAALAFGAWFGGMAILLVVQLVFYYFQRQPQYALLAIATLVAMMVYTGTLGLSRVYLFPGGGIGNDLFTAGTSWLGLATSALAGASILELKRHAPRLNRLFQAGVGVGIAGVVIAAAGANLVFADFANLTILVLATAAAVQSLRTAGRDGAGSRLRATAFCALWVGLVATVLQRAGVGTLPEWVAHGYAVSALVQTVLLTGSLAARLRAAEATSREMQQRALEAARQSEQRAVVLAEEMTRELAGAKQIAEDALTAELASQRRQVRFMEVISHQYRTPLAAIRTHVDNIDLSLPEDDTANRRRLGRVRRGIARLVEVLEVNLSRSRFQGPAFKPEMQEAALAEIVGEAARRGRDLLQHEIVVEVSPEAERARVRADTQMLGIAIINLLENAAKFSALQGKSPVRLSCRAEGGEGIIAVADRGMGIAPEDRGRIFGRFVRGANAAGTEGQGLGLSLVSRIVEAHGGTIGIESELGAGTTVRIALPLAGEAAEAEERG